MTFNSKIDYLADFINDAENVVFLGGAGVSTESGIPDFRSKDGLYNKPDINFAQYEPEYLLSSYCLYENPKVFYEFYRQKLDTRNAIPNITHYALARLEKNGCNLTIVTQNVDGLHQKAGSKNVLEIHGSSTVCYCRRCGREYPMEYIFESKEEIPLCKLCKDEENEYCPRDQAYIRPKVSLYGEFLQPSFKQAQEVIKKADLLIVGGTSLKVYPAAGLVMDFLNPATMKLLGIDKTKRLVIINQQKTDFDDKANLVFNCSLGKVFNALSKLQGLDMSKQAERSLFAKRLRYKMLHWDKRDDYGSYIHLSADEKAQLNQILIAAMMMSDEDWQKIFDQRQ